MENNLTPIILLCFISLVYVFALLYKLHDRVIFYEELEEGNSFNIYVEGSTSVFPLVVNKIHNYDITSYVDITFDYVKYYNVPIATVYNLIKKSYTYDKLILSIDKYRTNDL